jgi:hypothetical protein
MVGLVEIGAAIRCERKVAAGCQAGHSCDFVAANPKAVANGT